MDNVSITSRIRTSIAYSFLVISFPLFLYAAIYLNVELASIAILLEWIFLFLYNFSRKRVMLFTFSLTFFAFLLGEVFINLFDDTRLYDLHTDSLMHTFICLYLSIISVHLGSFFSSRIKFIIGKRELFTKTRDIIDIVSVRKASKLLFFLFATCSLLIAIERLMMVNTLGSYTATFVNYHSSLPSIISKFDDMTDMAFFLYLATLPDPKKSKSIFGYKVLIALIILLYGTRNTIIMTLIVIVLYCVFYEDAHNMRYKIIPKTTYYLIGIALPIVFVLFDYIMSIRDGRIYYYGGVITSLKNIISSIGGSINVITYGYEYQNALGQKLYSVGNIIDFFTQNVFARIFFGAKQYGGNTVEMALYGHSFSSTITYLVKRTAYLNGYGMGSCYIAETFHDFGYFGVFIINLFYGSILSKFSKLDPKNYIWNTLVLMATYNILLAPRSYTDGFISCFLNFSFLLTLLLLYLTKQLFSPKNAIVKWKEELL